MDHHYIEEHNIADLYLMGKLDPRERELFEDHFADCQQCLDALEEIEGFRMALRANSGLFSPAPRRAKPRLAALLRPAFAWRGAIATAAALLLFVAALWLVLENMRLRNELKSAQVSLTDIQSRAEPEQELAVDTRRAGDVENQNDNRNLQSPPEPLPRPGENQNHRAPQMAQVNTPIFALSAVRTEGAEQINDIVLDNSTRWFLISADLEAGSQYQSYRAVIRSPDQRVVWTGKGLKPNRFDALTMSFTSDFLRQGEYYLTLEGVSPQSAAVQLAVYHFRITKKSVK